MHRGRRCIWLLAAIASSACGRVSYVRLPLDASSDAPMDARDALDDAEQASDGSHDGDVLDADGSRDADVVDVATDVVDAADDAPRLDGGGDAAECAPGFDDCDDMIGCETDTRVSLMHCGGCGAPCAASAAACERGVCRYGGQVTAAFRFPTDMEVMGLDASGDVTIAGSWGGDVDLGDGMTLTGGYYDLYVVRYAADGTFRWKHVFWTEEYSSFADMDVTLDGRLYLAGTVAGDLDFGMGAVPNTGTGTFFCELNATGQPVLGSFAGALLNGIGSDSAGRIYVAGIFYDDFSFGGPTFTTRGDYDIAVAGFDASGAYRHSSAYGSTELDSIAAGLSVAQTGDVAIRGQAGSSLSIGAMMAGEGSFVARFSSDGAPTLVKSFGPSVLLTTHALDADLGFTIVGAYSAPLDLGAGTMTPVRSSEALLASFDAEGDLRFAWTDAASGPTGYVSITSMVSDEDGNIVIAGGFAEMADFGDGVVTSMGGQDAFVASYAQDGALRWARVFGTSSWEYASHVAVGANGAISVAFNLAEPLDFGSGAMPIGTAIVRFAD